MNVRIAQVHLLRVRSRCTHNSDENQWTVGNEKAPSLQAHRSGYIWRTFQCR